MAQAAYTRSELQNIARELKGSNLIFSVALCRFGRTEQPAYWIELYHDDITKLWFSAKQWSFIKNRETVSDWRAKRFTSASEAERFFVASVQDKIAEGWLVVPKQTIECPGVPASEHGIVARIKLALASFPIEKDPDEYMKVPKAEIRDHLSTPNPKTLAGIMLDRKKKAEW